MFMRIFAVVGVALSLVACSAVPIYNVQDQTVATATGKAPSTADIRSAIVAAGAALGWQMRDVKPGVVEGTLTLRSHVAVVEIPYNAKTYSIVYKSSSNLDEKGGQIHKNYNAWVQNLQRGINARISAIN
jgi:hypothetical protein